MKLIPMPDGQPDQHLGVSHTLKHYLAPTEAWEDLALDLPAHARPRDLAIRLELTEADCELEGEARAELIARRWTDFLNAFRDGYTPTVMRIGEEAAGPDQAPGQWHEHKDRWLGHIGQGIVVWVSRTKDGRWRLYTAYRPADFKLRDYSCPPVNAASVSIRRQLAVQLATKHVAAKRREY